MFLDIKNITKKVIYNRMGTIFQKEQKTESRNKIRKLEFQLRISNIRIQDLKRKQRNGDEDSINQTGTPLLPKLSTPELKN